MCAHSNTSFNLTKILWFLTGSSTTQVDLYNVNLEAESFKFVMLNKLILPAIMLSVEYLIFTTVCLLYIMLPMRKLLFWKKMLHGIWLFVS